MINRLGLRFPSPALIVACLALFAALGGSTYAATQTTASTIHFTNAKLISGGGWAPAGGNAGAPGYAKDSLGVVHLRGALKNGIDGDPAFALPKGLRPTHLLRMPVYTDSGTVGSLLIFHNGDVTPSGTGVSAYTSLAGISFPTGS